MIHLGVSQKINMRILRNIFGFRKSAGPFPRTEQKKHLEALIDATLPFAEIMLKNHQEFHPYGATMAPDKVITNVGGATADGNPAAGDLIFLIRKAYREQACSGEIMASALAYDIRTIPPGSTEKKDAVAIELDHRDGMSIIMIYPYVINSANLPVWESGYAHEGEYSVFGRNEA